MKLQDKLDKLRDDFENGRLPLVPTAEQIETMHRATKMLTDSGQASRALKAGDKAPDFSLPDPEGNVYILRDLLVRGPLVVTFYRGVWCPFCNLDLAALEAERSEIEARGAQLLAISPQTLANSRRSQRDNKLNFPILSDHDSEVAATFGIRFSLPDDLIEVYKSFGSNLSQFNAGQDWRLPMPARYVIGRDGVIVYAEITPDYTRRPDPSELLPVLDKLRSN
ncbi:peroxiredoxin-like family protein [Rhizobium halophytocola]|uniref:thioredoxin-dependent peroxiredoxin n=1 Tax=Rhizobium halophytocola TaxID=735519 RepID=A0ABS4E4M3_9HYPH|nr:peroxiredoxin-like family protein [Rhizobium halophytocola]MBP1852900.1 peroxiredoxin [Rhizobium halophytocola]